MRQARAVDLCRLIWCVLIGADEKHTDALAVRGFSLSAFLCIHSELIIWQEMNLNIGVFQPGRGRFGHPLRLFPKVLAYRVAFALHVPEHQHAQLIGIPAPQRVDDLLMFPHRLAQPVAAN
jgi:hypothetical protein